MKRFLNRLPQRQKRTHTDADTHKKGPGLDLSLTHASHIQRLVTTVKSEHVAISAVANAVSRQQQRSSISADAFRAPPIIPPHLI